MQQQDNDMRARLSPAPDSGIRLSSSSLHVRSATTVICGIIVDLGSSESRKVIWSPGHTGSSWSGPKRRNGMT